MKIFWSLEVRNDVPLFAFGETISLLLSPSMRPCQLRLKMRRSPPLRYGPTGDLRAQGWVSSIAKGVMLQDEFYPKSLNCEGAKTNDD